MADDDWLYRHPRRGQAHLPASPGALWSPVATVCGLTLPEYERIRQGRTDPADRCRRCFPPGADEREGTA